MKSEDEEADSFPKLLNCGSDSFLSVSELMNSVEVMELGLDTKLVSLGDNVNNWTEANTTCNGAETEINAIKNTIRTAAETEPNTIKETGRDGVITETDLSRNDAGTQPEANVNNEEETEPTTIFNGAEIEPNTIRDKTLRNGAETEPNTIFNGAETEPNTIKETVRDGVILEPNLGRNDTGK